MSRVYHAGDRSSQHGRKGGKLEGVGETQGDALVLDVGEFQMEVTEPCVRRVPEGCQKAAGFLYILGILPPPFTHTGPRRRGGDGQGRRRERHQRDADYRGQAGWSLALSSAASSVLTRSQKGVGRVTEEWWQKRVAH